jgi:DNA-binding NtrC family response regulator
MCGKSVQQIAQQLRVLVVEDEALIRWSIVETLAHGGHTVVEATDAEGAVKVMADATEPIDVVLLDFRLPDSHDLGLLTTIRRMMPGSAVVLMTAYGTPEIREGALDLGVFRVMSKPFDMHGLESLVQEAHLSRASSA